MSVVFSQLLCHLSFEPNTMHEVNIKLRRDVEVKGQYVLFFLRKYFIERQLFLAALFIEKKTL